MNHITKIRLIILQILTIFLITTHSARIPVTKLTPAVEFGHPISSTGCYNWEHCV